MSYPEDFMWGVSTSAYQLEGAPNEDGKGLSVWDVFCRQKGRIFQGHTGDMACDHYHRYKQDVALLKQLGIPAYRFSLSWPRIQPQGTGAVNAKGLGFYDRLVDELLAAEIVPLITLFHWDMPYTLYMRGGWLNPASSDWFADYTRVAVDALSDRVRYWNTMEEPVTFVEMGYRTGEHAPGVRLPGVEILQAAHHTLLAHGKSVQVIRAHARQAPIVSCDATGGCFIPLTDSPQDIAAARKASFVTGPLNAREQQSTSLDEVNTWNNSWWGDPIYLGRYPEQGLRLFREIAPKIAPGDMETINQPLDWCMLSVYGGKKCRAGQDGEPERIPYVPGYATTTQNNWAVEPDCLYWAARFTYERYQIPVVIAENGFQNIDNVALDGQVHDPQRIDYTRRVLLGLERALDDGIPVEGYFHWTIMDNFEWAEGYNIRVGLVHTDFVTQKRTPKDSAYWYQKIVESNGKYLAQNPF